MAFSAFSITARIAQVPFVAHNGGESPNGAQRLRISRQSKSGLSFSIASTTARKLISAGAFVS